MKCQRCNKNYPDRFLAMMAVQGKYTRVDPECALEIMTEVHGFDFTEFNGEVAQQMLEDFREWISTQM